MIEYGFVAGQDFIPKLEESTGGLVLTSCSTGDATYSPEPEASVAELVPIHVNDGVQAVMGRDLYTFLEVQSNYTTWINRLIGKYGFVEGTDYLSKNGMVERSGRGQVEQANHILTMDMAKEISMVQNNQKGREARQYFIECEKKLHQAPAVPELSRMDLLQLAMDAERERIQLEYKNNALETKIESRRLRRSVSIT